MVPVLVFLADQSPGTWDASGQRGSSTQKHKSGEEVGEEVTAY